MGSEVVKEFWVISKRGLSRVNKLGLNGQQYSAHINFLWKSLSENPEGFGITHKRNKSRICHKYQGVAQVPRNNGRGLVDAYSFFFFREKNPPGRERKFPPGDGRN